MPSVDFLCAIYVKAFEFYFSAAKI
jgi:hypothetical protein